MKFFGDGVAGDISKSNWIRGEILGSGRYGNVFSARLHNSKQAKFAVKIVTIFPTEENKQKLLNEIEIIKTAQHERTVKFFGFCSQESNIFLFMELMSKGTLKDFIASIGKLQEKQVKRIAKQLLEGVEYLHKKRILHRDLKSRNILMSDDENTKIADFGISKQFQTFSVAETYTGTLKYMAPEMFTGAKYSYPVDIWAVGCVVVEMLTGKEPFSQLEEQQIIYNVTTLNICPKVDILLSPLASDLLTAVFEKDPHKRPCASKLLQLHPFINDSKNLTLFSSDINTDGGKLINSQSELIGFRPLLKLKLNEDLNLLLQRLARLTVKLKIKYTSPHRPEKFNVTQTACYKSCPRFGTGLITFCFNQGGKEGYIKIATDSMNVFDETEAIKTECILNYDDYDSEIIVLNDCTFINKKNEPGITELMFSFVDEYIDCYSDICNLRQVIDKLSETFYSNIIYMVSHPQGLPKHVSIGIITNEEPASSGTDSTLPFNSKYYEDGVIPGIRGAPIYQSGHKVRYNNGMGYKTDHNVFLTADFASKNIFWQKLIEEVD